MSIWRQFENSQEFSPGSPAPRWEQMEYQVRKDEGGRDFYRLTVEYAQDVSNLNFSRLAQIRLVPYDGDEYGTLKARKSRYPLDLARTRCLPYISPSIEIERETSSGNSQDTAFDWMQTCRETHAKYRKISVESQRWLPTRLIDIRHEDSTI